MSRRRFDHLFVEVCVAADRPLSRYRLWMRIHESGADPETLTGAQALAFCDGPLDAYLSGYGIELTRRARGRLARAVRRYDPRTPSPEETFARI